MSDLKVGVIGMGFVGTAVSRGFEHENTLLFRVDPKLGQDSFDISELTTNTVDVVFLCLPTPKSRYTNDVDVSIVDDVLDELSHHSYKGLVVIKSSITPEHLNRMALHHEGNLRIVYNPEFLVECDADEDFRNPFFQVIGGALGDCSELQHMIEHYSCIEDSRVFKTDITTASLIKYALNSYYATKVVFMNELHAVHDQSGAETTWDEFTEILDTDPRFGPSHLMVPGPDGQYGFGGNCFPKDTAAFLHYAWWKLDGANLSVLSAAVDKNTRLRAPKTQKD
tara:strand:+ start:424 stop:1266 length:843 start_codon:yes stop_codon:yes gene_type:complete